MYPDIRLRRNKRYIWSRDLVSETSLVPTDLILPIFVIDGMGIKESIDLLPDVYRFSIDLVLEEVKKAAKYNIPAVCLFPVISKTLKSDNAAEAINENNLITQCIKEIKKLNLNIGIICDVALDPYTLHGHDGIIVDSDVDNDRTIDVLIQQSLVLAQAGADYIAPSDMMDGRVAAIRKTLDKNDYSNVGIISYSAKYSSNFYGPFRNAIKTNFSGSKDTYQLDYRNSNAAILKISQDISESADAFIVKPAMSYLDIIYRSSNSFNVPILAYQVSGEYAMLKFLVSHYGKKDIFLESMYSIKRSGANAIISYAAVEVARMLLSKN